MPLEMKADGSLETHGTQWGDLSVRHVELPAGTACIVASSQTGAVAEVLVN
jgi:hypothetical protein